MRAAVPQAYVRRAMVSYPTMEKTTAIVTGVSAGRRVRIVGPGLILRERC